MFGAFTKIKRVIIDPKYSGVELHRNVGELVIKGKRTKVVSYSANDAFDKTVITTVKGAKAISFAKKKWIKKGKTKYIIYGSNKKNGKYRKITTTEKTEYSGRYKYIRIEV